MGNRALQLVTLIVAVAVGGGAAYGVRAVRNVPTQQASSTSSTPNAGASPSATSSPTTTDSPTSSPAASPSPSPSPAPSASPTPSATAAGYPAQLQAGSTYPYSGRGTLAALATDGADNGSSVCAGITNSDQNIPNAYLGAYFVSVTFRDGQVLSAGYVRNGSTSNAFGQRQSSPTPVGNKDSTPTGAGVHTYCVSRSGGGWNMTADGAVVYSTTAEAATSFAGASINFESTIQRNGTAAVTAINFVVPGFQALTVDGQPPTQLKGSTRTF